MNCLRERFGAGSREELESCICEKTPTQLVVYPPGPAGESFPFSSPEAEGFIIGKPEDENELYAAYLEGIGLVERWGYELVEELGAPVGERIYVGGIEAPRKEWLQLRANILNKTLARTSIPEPAFAAALVAAGAVSGVDLPQVAQKMVALEREIVPQPEKVESYARKYRKFRNACRAVGYG